METVKMNKEVPVMGRYDVIIAGGGIAGCAAAMAAARRGHSVLLLEKTVCFGGLATNGLVVLYNPSLCDRKGRRIIGGISQELLHASIRRGCGTLDAAWAEGPDRIDGEQPYQTQFNAPNFVCALDTLMAQSGVNFLFDTVCTDILMEDGLAKGVFVENKGGTAFYECRQLIDATGDLDLFYKAGAPCCEDLNWLSYWALTADIEGIHRCAELGDVQRLLNIRMLGTDRDGLRNPPGVRRYTVGSGEEVTKFIFRGRAYLRNYLEALDPKEEIILQIPAQAQYRTTRHPESAYVLTDSDKNVRHEDAVGCAWTYRDGGFFIEIPYGTLRVPGYRNMLTAGRSIGATGMACEVTRLIAPCAVTGEAAGTAASLAIENGIDVNFIPYTDLQNALRGAGAILHFHSDER